MKKMLSWLLMAAILISFGGCGSQVEPSETTVQPAVEATAAPALEVAVPETEIAVPETEAPALEDPMFLKVASITFSLVGESEDIYLGLVPRELVTWESEDASVVSVENGVLTAAGVGTTTIRATYNDRQLTCTAGCLAETPEELESLGFDVLCQPKRLLPEVDLQTACTYFENAALVGDSISYMMMQTESKGNYLGGLLFLARGGTSLNGFVHRVKNVSYRGVEMNLEDAVAKSGVERIYILIGSNDIASEPQRITFFENWDIMLERIRAKSPDVEIVLISNIPQYAGEAESKGSFFRQYNSLVAEYNQKMRELAQEKGCLYLDLHCYVEDHCGRMARDYNLDGYHLNETGYHTWMKVLRYYAQYELEGGTLA